MPFHSLFVNINFYKVLGLSTAERNKLTLQEIGSNAKRLLLQNRKDGKDIDASGLAVKDAFNLLKNETNKARYDAWLDLALNKQGEKSYVFEVLEQRFAQGYYGSPLTSSHDQVNKENFIQEVWGASEYINQYVNNFPNDLVQQYQNAQNELKNATQNEDSQILLAENKLQLITKKLAENERQKLEAESSNSPVPGNVQGNISTFSDQKTQIENELQELSNEKNKKKAEIENRIKSKMEKYDLAFLKLYDAYYYLYDVLLVMDELGLNQTKKEDYITILNVHNQIVQKLTPFINVKLQQFTQGIEKDNIRINQVLYRPGSTLFNYCLYDGYADSCFQHYVYQDANLAFAVQNYQSKMLCETLNDYYQNQMEKGTPAVTQPETSSQTNTFFQKLEVNINLNIDYLLPSKILPPEKNYIQTDAGDKVKVENFADIFSGNVLSTVQTDIDAYIATLNVLFPPSELDKLIAGLKQGAKDSNTLYTYFKLSSQLMELMSICCVAGQMHSRLNDKWFSAVNHKITDHAWLQNLEKYQQEISGIYEQLKNNLLEKLKEDLGIKVNSWAHVYMTYYPSDGSIVIVIPGFDFSSLPSSSKALKADGDKLVIDSSYFTSAQVIGNADTNDVMNDYLKSARSQANRDLDFQTKINHLPQHNLTNPIDQREETINKFGEKKNRAFVAGTNFAERQKAVKVIVDKNAFVDTKGVFSETLLKNTLSRENSGSVTENERWRTKFRMITSYNQVFFNDRGDMFYDGNGKRRAIEVGMVSATIPNFRLRANGSKKNQAESPKDRELYVKEKTRSGVTEVFTSLEYELDEDKYTSVMQQIWSGILISGNDLGGPLPERKNDPFASQEDQSSRPVVLDLCLIGLGDYINKAPEFQNEQAKQAAVIVSITGLIDSIYATEGQLPNVKHIVLALPNEKNGAESKYYQQINQLVQKYNKDPRVGTSLPYFQLSKAGMLDISSAAADAGFLPVILNPSSANIVGGGYTHLNVEAVEEQLFGLTDAAKIVDGQFNAHLMNKDHWQEMYLDPTKNVYTIKNSSWANTQSRLDQKKIKCQRFRSRVPLLTSFLEEKITQMGYICNTQIITFKGGLDLLKADYQSRENAGHKAYQIQVNAHQKAQRKAHRNYLRLNAQMPNDKDRIWQDYQKSIEDIGDQYQRLLCKTLEIWQNQLSKHQDNLHNFYQSMRSAYETLIFTGADKEKKLSELDNQWIEHVNFIAMEDQQGWGTSGTSGDTNTPNISAAGTAPTVAPAPTPVPTASAATAAAPTPTAVPAPTPASTASVAAAAPPTPVPTASAATAAAPTPTAVPAPTPVPTANTATAAVPMPTVVPVPASTVSAAGALPTVAPAPTPTPIVPTNVSIPFTTPTIPPQLVTTPPWSYKGFIVDNWGKMLIVTLMGGFIAAAAVATLTSLVLTGGLFLPLAIAAVTVLTFSLNNFLGMALGILVVASGTMALTFLTAPLICKAYTEIARSVSHLFAGIFGKKPDSNAPVDDNGGWGLGNGG